jgi:integrase
MAKARDTGLRYGEGHVQRREHIHGTSFRAMWRDDEGEQRTKTFRTDLEARQYLQQMADKRVRGIWQEPSRLTVRDLVLASIERNTTRRAARTTLTYRLRAEAMIYPLLGDRRAIDLTPMDVQRWIERLSRGPIEGKADGKGYEASSVHAAVSVLYGSLKESVRLGIIDRNAADGIRRPGIGDTRTQTWTEDEARRMLAAVREDELYGALYHVALATGMRPGELRALKWIDVDLDAGRLVVVRTLTKGLDGREVIANRTKTARGRAIALTEPIVRLLRWHRALQRERRIRTVPWRDDDLVFDRGDGKWISSSGWQKIHRSYCLKADVPVIRAHDLRHTFATLAIAQGGNIKIISDILGHSSITMTLDVYVHSDTDMQHTVLESLSDLFLRDDDVLPAASGNNS